MARVTPLGALARGLIGGAVGSAMQELFFRMTARIQPGTPKDAFQPPEPEQERETATMTVARRFTESLMHRRLAPEHKAIGGEIVHYAFGALWGGIYGLLRESMPAARKPLGMIGFASTVWFVSDNIILPAFRLSAWPHRYPMKNHAFAWLAHIPYALGVWGTYEMLRPRGRALLAAGLGAMAMRFKVRRHLPARLAPIAGSLAKSAGMLYLQSRLLSRRVASAVEHTLH